MMASHSPVACASSCMSTLPGVSGTISWNPTTTRSGLEATSSHAEMSSDAGGGFPFVFHVPVQTFSACASAYDSSGRFTNAARTFGFLMRVAQSLVSGCGSVSAPRPSCSGTARAPMDAPPPIGTALEKSEKSSHPARASAGAAATPEVMPTPAIALDAALVMVFLRLFIFPAAARP